MPTWFQKRIGGISFRYKCFRYGIWFGKSTNFRIPEKLRLKQGFTFIFNRANTGVVEYEFRETCLLDAYHLRAIKKRIKVLNIVDIGANQGLFILAARGVFPYARIDAYEPNPNLQGTLTHNAAALNVTVYNEAVGKQEGYADLQFGSSDLDTRTIMAESGKIRVVNMTRIIERIGGVVDILKMDCEGAEWDLLEQEKVWQKIKAVTMEYHLWAKPGMTIGYLEEKLSNLGYLIIHKAELNQTFGLITAVRKHA